VKLFYETRGAGEPLVLIPGFASGAWIWRWQIESLAQDFRVVGFDPRGVGRSKIEGNAIVSIETIAADVVRLLDDLKIARAHVLGASFGGFVAQQFAVAFPERLNKLILACTSAGGKNHVAPDLEVLAAFVSTDDLNKRERIRRFIVPAFTPEFYAANQHLVEKVCVLREQTVVPEAVYMQQLASATTFDFETRLQKIKAETLILTGDRDIVVPPQNSVNLAAKIPNAQLKIVENGSHMFFIENAAEFNRAVKEFIKS
jgi:pimeloyl-ACP methyl ester carboxylesterase